jgi:hypothetical protein
MKINFQKKLTAVLFVVISMKLLGQASVNTDYRRSSLTMVLIENNELGNLKDLVTKSYYSNPFPDKYNEHQIADKLFDPNKLKLTTQDFLSAGFYKDTLKTPKDFLIALKKPLNAIRYVTPDSTKAVQEPTQEQLLNIYISKYINEKKLAKQTVASWLNRTPNGDMDWSEIIKRGKYSASAAESENLNKTLDQKDYFKDTSLISNTYTLFNKLTFFANEPVARDIRDKAKEEVTKKLAGKPEVLLTKALQGIDAVYEKTKEGYTCIVNTYLYQLDWNDSIAEKTRNIFFNANFTGDKKIAWDTTSLFKMKFIGKTTTSSIVTFKIGEKRTEEQIIELQIKRSLDKALAKLQKEHVQFCPITPIESKSPLTAKIGLKEGVEPGQKYEVLKLNELNPLKPFLERVEVVTVPKKGHIWDNRQGADQEPLLDKEGNPIVTPALTTFDGGKKASETYFLRLIK